MDDNNRRFIEEELTRRAPASKNPAVHALFAIGPNVEKKKRRRYDSPLCGSGGRVICLPAPRARKRARLATRIINHPQGPALQPLWSPNWKTQQQQQQQQSSNSTLSTVGRAATIVERVYELGFVYVCACVLQMGEKSTNIKAEMQCLTAATTSKMKHASWTRNKLVKKDHE
uniref:Uncharacterized protein n=1 Tax=Trichogramma kaykai TaxID=54128 RepID=A0ABD2X1S9_9HYME